MSDVKKSIISQLDKSGWIKDRFGNYRKDMVLGGKLKSLRCKFRDRSFRLEVKIIVDDTPEWVRYGGDFYSKCEVLGDGRVRVGALLIGNL
ncbi:hypothetical protein P6F34_gp70 [Pseudomonas phage MiCath]|uniref:Uncharacterized protein n=1 Tax=Pseudomonas phage MiCath TaxID=3003729 RepID=A0AAE9VDG8_9CAUD|nr:hypothetical protein P6F34_gp70 [Pseudomonas phage MiCath]WAX22419.1 hypothetical protein [Pseudomonas phage MiCath]